MDVSVKDLIERLDPAGIPWVRDRYRAGALAWLRPRMGEERYVELGRRLDADDDEGARALLVGAGVLPAAGVATLVEDEPKRNRFGWIWMLPLVVVLALIAILLSRCGTDDDVTTTSTGAGTVVDLASGSGRFSTLTGLLGAAGLDETLAGAGPFTVFAPTDEAFAKLPKSTLDALGADTEALKRVLSYHVVPGSLKAASLTSGALTTVEGSELDIEVDGGTVSVGGTTVTDPDLTADNGVIHAIDGVLLPPGFEVPAATTTTTARATSTTVATASTPAPTTTSTVKTNTLVDVVAGNGQFKQLFDLVGKAGLADALKGPGPFTVFGPNDAAFAKLPKATLDAIAANPDALRKVLTYHVVQGNLKAADLKSGTLPTLNGEAITIALDGANVKVNNATVLQADLTGSNGVFHAIDTILLPANLNLSGAAQQKFTVFFESGVTTPNDASAATLQQALAAVTAAKAGTTVVLTGFADVQGDSASNLVLSQQRAENVRTTLAAANAGLGYVTNAKGDTEGGADLAQARRVEIVIG